jgi:hypothetical protein
LQVRNGYELWGELVDVPATKNFGPITITTTNGVSAVTLALGTGHGFTASQVINVTSLGTTVAKTAFTVGGITSAQMTGSKTITSVTATTITIPVSSAATSTTATMVTAYGSIDFTRVVTDVVNGTFFQNYLVLVDTEGVIYRINTTTKSGNVLWAGWPVTPVTTYITFFTFGGSLIVLNGKDKPVEIKANFATDWLVDPASLSNSAIPAAKYGIGSSSYTVLAGRSDKTAQLDISAKNTSGVYASNPAPDDALDLDMSKITNVADPMIMGLAELRDKLLVVYKDGMSVGTLGQTKLVGTDELHDPQFKDQVSQQGTISHRTIASLGNDIFMVDRVGVPSLTASTISGIFNPERMSDLIEPEIQKNLGRLSETTLSTKVFAVYNPRERQYMVFMPKHEATAKSLPGNPISFVESAGRNRFIINAPSHQMETGDRFTLAALTDIGDNLAASVNKTWTVWSVPDDDTIIVEQEADFAQTDITGGGLVGTYTPIVEETIGYIYVYNPKLKIKAWSRYRNLNFDWGAVDVYGRMFFGKGRKVYRFGTTESPVYADKVGEYNATWAISTAYTVGQIIRDSTTNNLYKVLIAHTSPGTGTLEDDVVSNEERWQEWEGTPIKFVWEWPWADFDKRINVKALRGVQIDADGRAEFSLNVFADSLYKNDETGELTPVRSMAYVASGAGGFGRGDQPYGGGRRTKEQVIWATPLYCKLLKLRFEGETTEPLRIIAVSLVYHEGGLRR